MINPALNLLPNAAGQARPQLLLAQVSPYKPAPATFTDPLYVVEPHQPDAFIQFANWPQLHGSTLPTVGTWVLLARDNYGVTWCIAW